MSNHADTGFYDCRASALETSAAIRAGELRAVDVVSAHIARLEAAQRRTRSIAVGRFDAARAEAEAADELVAAGSSELPPLLGVPCTVKESFAFAGMPQTAGLVSRVGRRAEADAPTVARLRAAGAIPLALTNTSELCIWHESSNRVYGRTSSAYDRRRTAGGSSGGEGAAVGSGGSIFGLGSDIGGSIRLPAYFNGVFGHKPTALVCSPEGHFPLPPGGSIRLVSPGPLARRAEDLMPVLRVLADPGAELGRPESVSMDGLRVTVLAPDGRFPVSRRVACALATAAGALASAGARVTHTRVRGMRAAPALSTAEISGAGPGVLAALLGGEDGPPAGIRNVLGKTLRGRSPHTGATLMLLAAERLNAFVPERTTRRLRASAAQLRRELAELAGDGVLLYPPFPWVAPRHHWPLLAPTASHYTQIFNVTGAPVTQIPVGLDERGLPLGVQAVGRPGNDHVTIAVAQTLENALGGWIPPVQDPSRRAVIAC